MTLCLKAREIAYKNHTKYLKLSEYETNSEAEQW